jgi:hypothetical protein
MSKKPIELRKITNSQDPQLEEALALYRRKFAPEVQIPEDQIQKWIDDRQDDRRPITFVIAQRDNKVVGFIHYSFDRVVKYAMVSYVAVVSNCFGQLMDYLKADLHKRGCIGVIFEVERLQPGLRFNEYEIRRRRLVIFQHFGARVLEGVRYLQPGLSPERVEATQELHLMFAPILFARTYMARAEVKDLLRFIYLEWYAFGYPNRRKYRYYLRWLYLRTSWNLGGRVRLVRPVDASRLRTPPGPRARAAAASLITGVGVAYKVSPVKGVIDAWVKYALEHWGHGVFVLLLLLCVALVDLLIRRPARESDE